MSKDTISVNMNVYDIPILVEQLKKLETENKQLKSILTELEEFLNHKLEQTGSYNKNDDEDRIEYLMHRYYAFREIDEYFEKLKEKYK